MCYCLHPLCPKPQNSAGAKFCKSCGRKLLLGDRFRAKNLLLSDSGSRSFLAVDALDPAQANCIIEQFLFFGNTSTPSTHNHNIQEKLMALFRHEVFYLEQLRKHLQIPKIVAFFTDEQYPCWVKEFVRGQNLSEILKRIGTFREKQIRSLLRELLPVLQFAHNKHIIHYDIRPENILYKPDTGKLFLTGFSSGKMVFKTAKLRPGSSLAFREYMAPELLKGEACFASDIYSFGLTCVYLMTGIHPAKLYNNEQNKWLWREHIPNGNIIKPQFADFIDKMIARKLENRYQSVAEVIEDFYKLPDFLYSAIDSLKVEHKRFIVKQSLAATGPGKNMLFGNDVDSMKSGEITELIYQTLKFYTCSELLKERITEQNILSLWCKYTIEVVEHMEVPPEWEEKKESVLAQLEILGTVRDDAEKQQKLENIAKDILLLLFQAMTEKEKQNFAEKVAEEAEKHEVKIGKNQLNIAKIYALLAGGATGLRPAAEPVIHSLIIERLTQGFLIPILASTIGLQQFKNWLVVLAGPTGWGLVILAALGSGVSTVAAYTKERRKVLFVQTIFSIYSYSIKLSH